MRERALPLQPAERHLLAAELKGVQLMEDEDPKFFFERISRLETTMRAVGIAKSDSEIIQNILRQLPERYDVVKIMILANPQLTRPRLQNTICSTYSQRKAHEIAKLGPAVGTPTGSPSPHALVVGHGFGDRGGGGRGGHQRDNGMIFRDGGMPRQQQQQQHWSRGGGMPRRQQQQCRGNSSNTNNDLAAVVSLINVAPILFLPPGRRDSSNRHGESLRSELAGSTTAGTTPYTTRRTHLPRQAHRCVRYTAVAVAANMGTSPNTVLHRVSLRELTTPGASMVTCGGTAPSVAANLI